ncbi:MAG: sigma-70 family RNA polymerase sigma factor [Usitatibacteraceae bacterium]
MTMDAIETTPIPLDIAMAYQGLRHALLGFLRKKVSDNDVAEDLLHEVFLKALSAIERGDSPSNFTGWLYSIAKNSVIDYYRAKRPTDPLPDELATPQPEDNVVEQDLARCLKPLTESLPPLYRNTLLATDFEGRTMQVIADQEGVSLSAVKSRASRGRQMLKQSLLTCCQVDVSRSGQVLDFQPSDRSPSCTAGIACKS